MAQLEDLRGIGNKKLNMNKKVNGSIVDNSFFSSKAGQAFSTAAIELLKFEQQISVEATLDLVTSSR